MFWRVTMPFPSLFPLRSFSLACSNLLGLQNRANHGGVDKSYAASCPISPCILLMHSHHALQPCQDFACPQGSLRTLFLTHALSVLESLAIIPDPSHRCNDHEDHLICIIHTCLPSILTHCSNGSNARRTLSQLPMSPRCSTQ